MRETFHFSKWIRGFILLSFIMYGSHSLVNAQCSNLVFQDEFNGTSVNETLWGYEIGNGCPSLCGFGNAEEQYYRKENATVKDGKLVITAKYENFGGMPYTSSKLTTSTKFNARFGRFEASIKLPSAGGVWPAFWLLPEANNWPYTGEIDIMEAMHRNPESIAGTVHYNNNGHQYNTREYQAGLDLSEGFHEYAVEWEPNEIRWYVDDQLYHTVTPSTTVDPWPFDEGEWYIMLNVAVGGPGTPFTGFIPSTPADYPTSMEVDYVHVYEGTFNIQLSGDNSVYKNDNNKRYSISPIEGATYNWSAPSGASIVAGQGTNEITVNWGTKGGDIEVDVNVPNCGANTYKMSVAVEEPRSLDVVFEDFENNRNFTYGATGTLDESTANPSIQSPNTSSSVGKYVRNASEQYDVLVMQSDKIGNALKYTSGEKVIWMDVYTNAPAGTEFLLQLENSTNSTNDYPAGRHSRYTANTTSSNSWQTLEFHLLDRPDAAVGAMDVDQFTLLIASNTNTDYTVYFDNVVSMLAAPPVLLDEEIIENYDGISRMDTIFSDGAYTADITNPFPGNGNTSAHVARYIRNGNSQYDVISFGTDAISNTKPFKNGENFFFMDLYTSAPAGTEITLSLEDAILSENDFPAGRNSQYSGFVEVQNGWHTVKFTHASSPDAGTSDLQVNEISMLFAPNSYNNDTYYFDNFRYGVTALPPTYSFSEIIQNYDGEDHLSFNSDLTNGTYTGSVANPSASDVNSSTTSGKYTRNASELYDVLFFNTDFIKDASKYVAEEKRFSFDVYTDAPAGTVISWQLEASSIANPNNYPNGRHSIYQAVVKESNAWQTLEFALTATPDILVENEKIDRVGFLFGPGTSTGYTFYIDNLHSLTKDEVTEPEDPETPEDPDTPEPKTIVFPGILEAEDYNDGGEGVGYHDTSAGNTGGVYRNDDVDIEATTDSNGGYSVGWITPGEWLAYDITSEGTSELYTFNTRVASTVGGSFHVEVDGTDITGSITVPNTGGWQTFTTVEVKKVALTKGNHTLKIVFDAGEFNINFLEAVSETETSGCSQEATSGDFKAVLDTNGSSHTLTFVPGYEGVGNSLVLLFYSTDANATFPGFAVQANEAVNLNVAEGETLYYYYTYSVPEGGERTSAGNRQSFTIGECNTVSRVASDMKSLNYEVYPNPMQNTLNVRVNEINAYHTVRVLNLAGKVLTEKSIKGKNKIEISTERLESGLYIIQLQGNSTLKTVKVIK